MTFAQLTFGDISLNVTFKDIKNLHLSVHPPLGSVTVSAPSGMKLETVRAFAVTKIGWIRRQQRKLQMAERAPAREYVDRESHYVWGQRYLLKIDPEHQDVKLGARHLTIGTAKCADLASRKKMLDKWYRSQLRDAANPIVEKWAKVLRIPLPSIRVRDMKTKWGSCSRSSGVVTINLDLAKKPKSCLEYVLLHEMAHFLEATHNDRFSKILDRAMPTWRARRDLVNSLAAPAGKLG